MPAPIILKIDLRKIPDEWVFKGAKGDYADCVAYENDEIDQYGNSHVIKLSPPRELREQGTKALIIGNGKWMPLKGDTRPTPPRQQTRPAPRPNAPRRQPPGTIQHPPPESYQDDMGDSDIPF